VTATSKSEQVSFDPYDFVLDADPYPVWARLRDEQPLYYNEEYDFYALSRFDDVERCLVNWRSYRSGRGTMLEVIKQDVVIPSGTILFEDPPSHDLHRSLLSRVFTSRRVEGLAEMVGDLCGRCLDPFVGAGGFDFVADFGVEMPMRTIGMLIGIPDEDQVVLRNQTDDVMRLAEGRPPGASFDLVSAGEAYAEYIDWRIDHPSDDLITELLHGDFVDVTGERRTLTRDEVVAYVVLLAGAGTETTTRLIGWMGKVLAEHPDQRRKLVDDRSLVPNAIEELLRYESPIPTPSRFLEHDVEHYGRKIEAGNVMMLLVGAANRDDRHFADPDRFDVERNIDRHLAFGYGIHFCLGAALARLEGRIALEEVLVRFPEWDLDTDGAVQAHTTAVRGWEKLPVLTG
jgi:cytochrome P450